MKQDKSVQNLRSARHLDCFVDLNTVSCQKCREEKEAVRARTQIFDNWSTHEFRLAGWLWDLP